MKQIECTRCHVNMNFFANERIQLGKTGWVLGDLPNLLAGALDVDIYVCPQCRKLELFTAESAPNGGELPQRTCPVCGTVHDFDYPKCPQCKFDYYSRK